MSKKYALIIGNTEYSDSGLSQLSSPSKDAEDFARILNDKEIGGFDDVKTLLNPLSSSVVEAVDEFFDEKKPDDLLVLYFSGHGVRDELGTLYLAVKNTIRTRLRSTAIKSDYIREAMDQSRSKRQLLILDCCNSGAFPQGTKAEVGGTMGITRAFQGYGRFVLTASDSTQFAWEGDQVIGETHNSLFTHFLVEGLKGDADSDGDGRITVDELYDYAYHQISQVTPKQTPTKSSSKQEGEIVLRHNMRIEDIKPMPLPKALIDSIENPFAEVRLGAVQQLGKLIEGKNLGLARSARDALEKIASDDDSRVVSQSANQLLAGIKLDTVEINIRKEKLKEVTSSSNVVQPEIPSIKNIIDSKPSEQPSTPNINAVQSDNKKPKDESVKNVGVFASIGCLVLVAFTFFAYIAFSSMQSNAKTKSLEMTVNAQATQNAKPVPTATLEIIPTSTSSVEVDQITDGFSDNKNQWPLGPISTERGVLDIIMNEDPAVLLVSITEVNQGFSQTIIPKGLPTQSNFGAAVNIAIIGEDGLCAGLLFRQSSEGYYAFTICSDQTYYVVHRDSVNSKWDFLIPKTKSNKINVDDANTIAFVAVGNTLKFLINGDEVGDMNDDLETTGATGLFIDTTVTGAVAFDAFTLIIPK